jgi:hypothetical protein
MKKILFISRSNINDLPGGVRFNNYVNYLYKKCDLTIINLTNNLWIYSRKNLIQILTNRLIKKLPLLPDCDILILNHYKKEIKKAIKKQTFDVIIIQVLPYSFLYLPEFIRSINAKVHIIVDLSDPATASISYKYFSKKRQLFYHNLEKESLKYINTLIVLNKELKLFYENKYKINNVMVIEQGIDYKFTSISKPTSRNNPISLIYAGNFYKKGREPLELYKAIELLQNKVKLSIYGYIKSEYCPPDNLCFHLGGRITREELHIEFEKCDIIVFIDNKDTLQVPGKTLETLALNKPVLFIYFNEDSPTLNYIKDQPGIYLAYNQFEAIADAIERLISFNCFYFERKLDEYYWHNLLKRLYSTILTPEINRQDLKGS